MQGRQLPAQRRHRLAALPALEVEVLEHQPAMAFVLAGAQRAGHPHRGGCGDRAQAIGFRLEHGAPPGAIELDEVDRSLPPATR